MKVVSHGWRLEHPAHTCVANPTIHPVVILMGDIPLVPFLEKAWTPGQVD